ncbi:DHH family protein [Pantoea sp. Ap-967]|uniref:DHH family phosphoesterase n=1 Tax=Pantoea sp. Ap-967 TaxID=2608362 RepID=UPI00141FEED5|nr:DHH family phosphoesterase [Pantoea sp. Ap-967]NIE77482.1 DHH family protein [Pantoea sp. Ap-967]
MRVVTSGAAYLDIDAYACCIAYAELLNRQGIEAQAVSSAPTNFSVPASVLGWGSRLDGYVPAGGDEFVLVDVSDPRHVDSVVVLERVTEVIDHHPGFERYWAERLGNGADIRRIGAAATQVFQRWEQASLLPCMSRGSASLLATAIVDNTLNFTSLNVTEADRHAYRSLAEQASLPDNWPQLYLQGCQDSIEAGLVDALQGDVKRFDTAALPRVFAQLTVWDARKLVDCHRPALLGWLHSQGEDAVVNVIGISDGTSIFVAISEASRGKLSRLAGLQWKGDLASVTPSLLRKDVLGLSIPTAQAR